VQRVGAHEARLVDDEHAEAVAGIEKLGRGRIVRATVGVAAHGEELADAEILQAVGQGDADAGVVLVVVGALEEDVFVVEEKSAVGVEAEGADAEARLVAVDDGLAGAHEGDEGVQGGVFEGPQARGLYGEAGVDVAGGLRGEGAGGAGGGGEHLAVGREDLLLDDEGGGLAPGVFDGGGGGDFGGGVAHLGADEGAVGRHVYGRGFFEPGVAVDAGAFVEPAFLHGDVDAHGDDVFAAEVGIVGDVVAEAEVAAGLLAEVESVYPHTGGAEDAVEDQAQAPALIARGQRKGFPIPAHARLRETRPEGLVAVAVPGLSGERHLHAPVVREVELAPAAVVEVRGGGTVAEAGFREVREVAGGVVEIFCGVARVAKGEAPVGVEWQAFADGGGGLGGERQQAQEPAE